LTAVSLQETPVKPHFATGLPRGTRLSTAAAAASGRAALAAMAAAGLTAGKMPAELDQFIDELAGIVHCPITAYQRELLQTALIGTIDARFAALLSAAAGLSRS
jgi:hypothetical protein